MAAALTDRLVHHCHLVTILGKSYRGKSYRMRRHTGLWLTHALPEPESGPARRRRVRHQEAATI